MTTSTLPPRSPGSDATSGAPGSVARTPRPRQVLLASADGVCAAWANAQAAAAGWSMDCCSSADDAVRRVVSERYSAVLLDGALAADGAARAIRLIRAWEGRRRRTYVIALLDPTAAGAREELRAAGADECVPRLLDASALWDALERAAGDAPAGRPPGAPDGELDPHVPRSPRLSQLFLAQIPEALAELGQALEGGDASRIGAIAHKLKGSSIALGAWVMATRAAELQTAAERRELARARAEVAALGDHFDRAAAELRAELSGPAAAARAAPPDPDAALGAAVDDRPKGD